MSIIPQGDTDQSREGDRLRLTSIQFRCNIIGADTSNMVRLIFFQWLIDDTVDVPAPDEILQVSGIGQPWAPLTPYTKDKAGYKFVVIHDETLLTSVNGNLNNFYHFTLPVKKHKNSLQIFNIYQLVQVVLTKFMYWPFQILVP